MESSVEISNIVKSYNFNTDRESISYSPFEAIVSRLMEKNILLSELISDTETYLEYCRMRREIWNDWSVIIDSIRSEDHNETIKVSTSPKQDNNWQAIKEKIPKTFSDLNQNFSDILKQKNDLSEYKKYLSRK